MLKIAHRGASGYCQENTIESFQKAIDLKADMIELDVHDYQEELIVTHSITKNKRLYPSLKEVVELTKGKIKLNIEVKGVKKAYPNIVSKIVDIIKEYQLKEEVILSSFNEIFIKEAKELLSELKCGFLFDSQAELNLTKAKQIGVYSVHPLWHICTPGLVGEAHRRGLKVYVWTVNLPDQVRSFQKMGVDGIMSDYPDIL